MDIYQILGMGTVYGAFAGAIVSSVFVPEIYDIVIDSVQRNGINGPITRAFAHPPCEGICGNALCGAVVGGMFGSELERAFSEPN